MTDLELRGFVVQPKAPAGAVPVCGPYRPGLEDWMLYRAINDFRARGVAFVLVREKARENRGGFIGVSIFRLGHCAPAHVAAPAVPAGEASAAPAGTPPPTPGDPVAVHGTTSPAQTPKPRRASRSESCPPGRASSHENP